MDEAVALAHIALFVCMGQTCAAGSRHFVHESVYDDFVKKSVDMAKSRTIGDPFDPTTRHGPQVGGGMSLQLRLILQFLCR